MALLRYPGSKERILDRIVRHFPPELYGGLWAKGGRLEYREPFFGGGSVGFHVLERMDAEGTAWINDADLGVSTLWMMIKGAPDALISRVASFVPSVESFREFKSLDGDANEPTLDMAFRKLALHRMSYSGLGVMAGGPIGGAGQKSAYGVGCRWNAKSIIREIRRLHRLLNSFYRVSITDHDHSALVDDAPEDCFIYLDPPYVAAGPSLYKHSFSDADHQRLAGSLRRCKARWVLSYDDHPMVRDLYGSWCHVREIDVTYTTAKATKRRPANSEIVIYPRCG
jgi:DNA adenine methylase